MMVFAGAGAPHDHGRRWVDNALRPVGFWLFARPPLDTSARAPVRRRDLRVVDIGRRCLHMRRWDRSAANAPIPLRTS